MHPRSPTSLTRPLLHRGSALPGTGRRLLLPVGPAASGKSRLLARLTEAGLVDGVVSTDALRAAHGLDPAERDATYALTEQAISSSTGTVALDATNLVSSHRQRWYELASRCAIETVVLGRMPDVPLSTLLARDAARTRHVPADVIEEMHAAVPTLPQLLDEAARVEQAFEEAAAPLRVLVWDVRL